MANAVVSFGGFCSGVVVSPDGLVFTNHHCGYDAIQQHSSVEHDYLRDGFVADSLSKELPNPDLFVSFLIRTEDVTERERYDMAPRILALNKAEKGTKIWCAGVDRGAYQAVNCRLRRPNLFAGAVGMGGIYNLSRFWGVENDDLVLRCSPLQYLAENGIADKLALAKAKENSLMLCAGQGAYEDDAKADTQALADVLAAQGLPAHLEIWGGDVSHEWYWWGKMLGLFVPRILEK